MGQGHFDGVTSEAILFTLHLGKDGFFKIILHLSFFWKYIAKVSVLLCCFGLMRWVVGLALGLDSIADVVVWVAHVEGFGDGLHDPEVLPHARVHADLQADELEVVLVGVVFANGGLQQQGELQVILAWWHLVDVADFPRVRRLRVVAVDGRLSRPLVPDLAEDLAVVGRLLRREVAVSVHLNAAGSFRRPFRALHVLELLDLQEDVRRPQREGRAAVAAAAAAETEEPRRRGRGQVPPVQPGPFSASADVGVGVAVVVAPARVRRGDRREPRLAPLPPSADALVEAPARGPANDPAASGGETLHV
mmetsp:Transcript_872/g.2379  ORF Transcript_872/g.2379 Transcript_872/m.2379 type:complete len:306 (-) Transcript_872:176-1093(-)